MIGNILWFVLGGAITGLSWGFAGLLWSCSIVGIPIGQQCFKIASLCFSPFNKEVAYSGGTMSFLMNMVWLSTTGWALAVESTIIGLICCCTIIGIPFGKQYFKIARLSLMPFGAEIYHL